MKTSIRPRLLVPTVGMLLLCGSVAWGDDSASGLLGCWRFEEGEGVYSANSADPAGEAELHNVSWVKGPFGKALRFAGTDSYVTLPSIAKLDGADRMTVTAWVYWEGTGQYPNVLTGGIWSPGGFLIFVNEQSCSFRMGRPGHRSGVSGEQWAETSAPFLHGLPVKKWVHLAAVFDRPEITTYVNGKKVGSAKWDYPVGHQGDLQVGCWAGKVSHSGLIDDVRIYGRALNAEEVAALANPQGAKRPSIKTSVQPKSSRRNSSATKRNGPSWSSVTTECFSRCGKKAADASFWPSPTRSWPSSRRRDGGSQHAR